MNKSYILFSSFKRDIFDLVFPEGMAEQRVPLFRNFVVNGLIQMTTYCESYQLTNVGFYDKDQSFDDCGLSVIQACRGQIGAVYAFKPSCRCQRFYYEPASLEKMSCLYENCRCAQTGCIPRSLFSLSDYTRDPAYCGAYVEGNEGCRPPYLTAEPEEDCEFKLSEKYYAIGPGNKLWLWPRFPCGYLVGVHWKGIRRSWLDTDYVLDDEDLKDAIAAYVESEVARRVDKDQATADKVYADYRLKAGDIIFREERDLKPRATRICIEGLDLSELVQIYPDNPYPVYVGDQCAQKKTDFIEVTFPNEEQSVACEGEGQVLTAYGELPSGFTIVGNSLIIAAGRYNYTAGQGGQAAANAAALAEAQSVFDAGIESGLLVCDIVIPDPPFAESRCGAWWKADSFDRSTPVGTPVGATGSEWINSLLPGTHDMVQATAAQRPTYQPNTFGVRPGILFDGSDDWLFFSPAFHFESSFGALSDSCTIFFVIRQNLAGNNGVLLSSGTSQVPPRQGYISSRYSRTFAPPAHELFAFDGIGSPFDSTIPLVIPQTDSRVVTFRNQTFNAHQMFRENKSTVGPLGQSNLGFAFDRFGIGIEITTPPPSPFSYFNGYVAEILIYCRILTDAECDQVYDEYLRVKYPVLPPQPPEALFTASTVVGDFPLVVQFTNSSTAAYTYLWDFGDGNTSTVANPTHAYASAGTYTVSLTATGADGVDTLTKTNYILVWVAAQPSDDDMESYTNGELANGLNGGTFWGNAVVDRSSAFGVQASDDMESNTDGALVNGLSSGTGWSAVYVDR